MAGKFGSFIVMKIKFADKLKAKEREVLKKGIKLCNIENISILRK